MKFHLGLSQTVLLVSERRIKIAMMKEIFSSLHKAKLDGTSQPGIFCKFSCIFCAEMFMCLSHEFDLYTINVSIFCRSVKDRIQKAIATFFNIPVSKLYLTKPTFFSKMNTTEAKTIHDEYWHPHIDKVGV